MALNIKSRKNALSIRLTESAVFLRTDYTPTRRNVQPTSSTRNGLLRGLLVLEITKPTKISSIDVELTGTTQISWPEGVGNRRMEVNEEHRIFHAATTYFRACQPCSQPGPSTHQRRTASIGPGVSYNHSHTVHYDYADNAVDDVEEDDTDDEDSMEGISRLDTGRNSRNGPSPSGTAFSRASSHRASDHPESPPALIPSSPIPIIRPPTTSRPSSRRVSIDGSQLVRPCPQMFQNYPGELAPIPPYSALPPPPSPSSSSALSTSYLSPEGVAEGRRGSYTETIPEDDLEERFDHHGLLRTHHDDDEEEELSLRVDHEVALESPRQLNAVPSLLQTAAGSSSLTSPIPIGRRGISPAPLLVPAHSTSGASITSASSAGTYIRPESRSQYSPPSPNLSTSIPPLSSSARSASSLHTHMQHRSLNSISSSSTNSQSNSHSHSHSHGLFHRHRSPSTDRSVHQEQRGRTKRFSFSNVTTMFRDALRSKSRRRSPSRFRTQQEFEVDGRRPSIDTMRGRPSIDIGDTRSPTRGDRRSRPMDLDTSQNESALEIDDEEEDSPRGRNMFGKFLMGNGAVITERDREGWKEFKKGTYTYPISFSIPSNAPPSMHCDCGSVQWQLKANVHRPGTFKTRMSAQRDVVIISCPTEEDTEDTENIIVERHWEQQLQYLISVAGRSFYIGGTVPVTLTLMPLAKMKIHRLSVMIEEKVDYFTNMRRLVHSDEPVKFVLLQIRREGKNTKPILPLESDDVEVLRDSPLMEFIDTDKDDLGEVASNLMGPGPWTFHKDLKLPSSCDILRITNRNKRANIQVTHMLKVVMRVERGDNLHVDKNGNRKLFDIVVQTPVLILSCRCNPEWASLPRYTEVFDNVPDISPSCPCFTHSNSGSRFRSLDRTTSRQSSDDSIASTAETSSIPPLSLRSLRNPQFSETLLRQSNLFERLVSGQESETGESPPAYEVPSSKRPPVVVHNVMVVG